MCDDDQSIEAFTNRKVECHLGVGLLNVGVEACFLVRFEPVSQGSGGDGGNQRCQTGKESEPHDAGVNCLLTGNEACQEFWPAGKSEGEFALFAPKHTTRIALVSLYSSTYMAEFPNEQ